MTLRAKTPDLTIVIRKKILLMGAAKVGKTWILCQVPNTHYIDTECGTREYYEELKNSNSVVIELTRSQEVFYYMKDLLQTGTDKPTLIIDSLSTLKDIESSDILESLDSFEREKKFQNQKGLVLGMYGWDRHTSLKDRINKIQNLISEKGRLDMNVIVVAYEKEVEKQIDTGNKYKKETITVYEPDLPKGSAHRYDHIVRVYRNPRDRQVYAEVEGRGKPIPTFKWNIENFNKYFKLDATPLVPIKFAEPEDVAFIKEHFAKYIGQENESKYLTKCKARTWEEVPKEKADKVIEKIGEEMKKEEERQKKEDEEFPDVPQ